MSDPNRIPTILDAVGAYWEQHTDQRFGEIISNAARVKDHDDAFYLEDAELVAAVQDFWMAEGAGNVVDPARIPVLIDAIRVYWTANSDLRLGQIVENASSYTGRRDGCFGLEDDELFDVVSFYSFSR